MTEQEIINDFHKIYYNKNIWKNTFWMGVNVQKLPQDLWIYQEIFYEIRPDLVIETGTAAGGSAYYMAHIMDILGKGKIITVDIEENDKRPYHQRITYLTGSSVDNNIINKIQSQLAPNLKVIVILDSDHSCSHVRQELELYSNFVTNNSYLIVEDSNINNHPVYENFGPGPMEAIENFLETNKNFTIDSTKEKFLITFNPKGFLKRI